MVKDWVKKLSEIERQTKESYGTDKSPADSFNLALWYYFNLTPEQFKKAGGVELLNLEKELGNQIIRETIFKNHDVSEAKLITGTPEQKAQFKQDKKRSIENEKIFNDSVSAKLSQKEFFNRVVKNLDSCFIKNEFYRIGKAYELTNEEREDLLSTCLIEILGNVIRGAFKPTGDANIETYYKGIIKKEVANFFKAKSKENKRIIPIQDPDFNDDQEEVIAQKPLVAKRDIYEDSIRQEKLEKLSKAINKLPSRQRKALNFSLKEIRQEEIAKKMGITQAGVNKLLTKARTNLYNLLLVPRGL